MKIFFERANTIKSIEFVKGAPYGNLLSAISEATFMIGMERSANVVRIASYAPLFCHENNRRWPVNLINYDNDNVYGLPSYYLQKLFSENNPEKVVKTDFDKKYGASQLFASVGILDNQLIIKVACFGTEDVAADINISNLKISDKAEETILASESETDTNSVVSPVEVSPSVRTKKIGGNKISHTFRACSFTMFKIGIEE